ncbi:MAG: hypothetical protein HY466_06640 [Deltaproteobacteria bacterium]|nr:hypothetical protein [Deltaproteobacteria bacterium]
MKALSRQQLDALFREIRGRYPRLAVLAIPWIFSTMWSYPLKPSPEHVQPFPIFVAILFRVPWLALRAIALSGRILWLRLSFRNALRDYRSRSFEGLAKTWAFSMENSGGDRDFYLGDLAEQLRSRNVRVLTLYDYGTNKKGWGKRQNGPRLPELALLSFRSVLKMLGEQCRAALLLYFKGFGERDKTLRGLIWLAGRDCLRAMTLRNGLFYWIGREAARRWKPVFFITLYEGNAWEKCLALGLRSVDSPCKLVGYQHTVIMPHAYELQRPSNSLAGIKPPELILSVGTRPMQWLQASHQPFGVRFIPFGTFRYFNPDEKRGIPRPDVKTLLVLPEGIVSEMIFLFDAALDLASLLPDYRILFRCHPAIPFEKVRSRLKRDLGDCPNVSLSGAGRIEEDFLAASMILYRGSSAILYAILSGLKPFYLRKNSEEEVIDPLFDLASWRQRADSVSELAGQMRSYSESALSEIQDDWHKANRFVGEYVQPVGPRSFDRFLEALQ